MAGQLLASQEVLFFLTLIFIPCNDFDIYNGANLQSNYSIIHFDESVYYSLSRVRSP